MNTTDLPAAIRECIDGQVQPVSMGEVRARAAVTRPVPARRGVERVPARRWAHPVPAPRAALLGVTATGVAAAGIAGALIASQAGGATPAGTAAGTRTVLTAATLKRVAEASQAAMTSGRARLVTATGGSTLVQQIKFDGANWNDVLNPGMPIRIHRAPHLFSWTGESINRVVDRKAYHYPGFAFKPAPHIVRKWVHIVAPGVGAPLTIPDPRTLLGVLSPSAGFVTDGYATVDGVRAQRLRSTTPATVPLKFLNPLIDTAPDNPVLSALSLWVDPSNVVLKARFTIRGSDRDSRVTVTVTFSHIGQPQHITAPPHYITIGHGHA